jgi:hypothetical protein
MVGRFVSSMRFREFKKSLGGLGRLLGGAFFSAYLVGVAITLGIMIIYLANFPETAKPTNFWVTMLLGLWIVLNLVFDFRRVFLRGDTISSSS